MLRGSLAYRFNKESLTSLVFQIRLCGSKFGSFLENGEERFLNVQVRACEVSWEIFSWTVLAASL